MLATLTTTTEALVLAASASDEGLNPLVKPSPGLMIWVLLVFVVSLIVLKKYAWPPITEIIDKRQRSIEEQIAASEAAKAESERLVQEYRDQLASARAESDEIVGRARRSGEQVEREAVEQARQTREDLLAQARKDIEAETRRAVDELRTEVAALTVEATAKVTRKTLTEADQQRLLDEALSEIDFSKLSGQGSR
ncbi:MAG: F0F1 ATP synthase subunit B [Patulibacter sp.]